MINFNSALALGLSGYATQSWVNDLISRQSSSALATSAKIEISKVGSTKGPVVIDLEWPSNSLLTNKSLIVGAVRFTVSTMESHVMFICKDTFINSCMSAGTRGSIYFISGYVIGSRLSLFSQDSEYTNQAVRIVDFVAAYIN